MDPRLRACLAELFGTFLIVLIGAGTVCATYLSSAEPLFCGVGGIAVAVALAEGCAVAVAVTATSYFATGCCNPAITLTLWVARKLELSAALGLMAAQLAGAFLAGLVVRSVYLGQDDVLAGAQMGTPHLKFYLGPDGHRTLAALAGGVALEALFGLVVTFAAFATLFDPRRPRIGGLGLGLAQAAVVLVGYQLTGAAANPARWFGPAVWQYSVSLAPMARPMGDHIVYWLGPVLGALAGGVFYLTVFLSPEKK